MSTPSNSFILAAAKVTSSNPATNSQQLINPSLMFLCVYWLVSSLNYAGQSDSEVCLRGVDRGALLRPLVLRANPFAVTNPTDINQFIRFGRERADFGRSAASGERASV